MLYFHLRPGIQNDIITSGFSRKFSFPPTHVGCPNTALNF